MKQSLQLKLGQQLTMTPQLQQAIKLLQLSTLDLQQEIQSALDSNPMLEVGEEGEEEGSAPAAADLATPLNGHDSAATTVDNPDTESASEWQNDIPEDLPVDTRWEEVYQSSSGSGSGGEDSDFDFDARNGTTDSLQDHLQWQLNLTRMSDTDRSIATAIIDAIDTNGRLTISPEEILEGMPADIELDEVVAVLHRIQQFDPPGVAGRDLRECLLIQL